MALNRREPRSKGRQANGVTASRCAGSYQLPPVAITHLQRLSTGFPLPLPGVISAFREARRYILPASAQSAKVWPQQSSGALNRFWEASLEGR